jgi:hypothetical protein
MKKARVVGDHAPVHAQVLVARAGERLQMGRTDDEWPGWVWCVSAEGAGSWVPETYLAVEGQEAWLLVDYDATELTVGAGEQLALHYEVNGWWWATDERGNEGWVPDRKVG